jgi:N-acetylmuramoyl-L-alanine amidase
MKILHFFVFIVLFASFSLRAKTILIDPGHGGIYEGRWSASHRLVEKDVVLTLSKKLAELLRLHNHTVYLTREDDREFDKKNLIQDLSIRANMTRTYKADIFISVHLNHSTNKKMRGFEIYVPYEHRHPIKSYTLASALHYELSHRITPRFAGGKLGNLNCIDGGIRAAKFNVLVKSVCPAVLIELDYLSHPTVEKELLEGTYQEQLAQAVCAGIRRYFKS